MPKILKRHPEPKGTRFFDQSSRREMILVMDDVNYPLWNNWIVYRHPDGQWVSLREATDDDRARITQALVTAHHS